MANITSGSIPMTEALPPEKAWVMRTFLKALVTYYNKYNDVSVGKFIKAWRVRLNGKYYLTAPRYSLRLCRNCGREFMPLSSNQFLCSPECARVWERRRKKEKYKLLQGRKVPNRNTLQTHRNAPNRGDN